MTREEMNVCLTQNNNYLFSVAVRMCNNIQDAKDLVQDTCLKALECFKQFVEGQVRSWLITIMKSLFVSKMRKASSRKEINVIEFCGEEFDTIFCDTDEFEQREYVSKIMSRLKERDRDMLVMVAQGKSMKQIAEAFNMPITTALPCVHRARKHAKKIAKEIAA